MNTRRPQFLEDLKSVLDKAMHDCNNELTGILLNCDMIKPENLEKKIAVVRQRTKKIIAILHSLSSLSKVNLNQALLATTVDGHLETLIADFNSELTEKNIVFSIKSPRGTEVSAAPQILSQILNYLLRNSIDSVAGAAKREIALLASPELISIADSGPPVEPDLIERMFAKDSMKKSHASLPLAIVNALIQLLGGRLQYHRAGEQNIFTLQFHPPTAPPVKASPQ